MGAPGVLECLTAAGETRAALVDEADFIQFTGSTRTGGKIAQRAAERLIPYSVELGGKDAMIVLADADLERAANGAVWGGMFNSGQACTSVERVFVEEPVYDEFVALVCGGVRGLRRRADGKRFDADVGALSSEAQLAIVERHVSEALANGAHALVGGKCTDVPGAFFEPTVLVDVDQSMSCMREETFGPTLPVMKVQDVEEAIRLANDSSYGLSASVWTRDRARGEQIARRLEVGAVNVQRYVHERRLVPDSSRRLEAVRRRRTARRRTRGSQLLPPAGDHCDPPGPPGPSCSGIPTPRARANWPCASLASCSHATGAAAWVGAGGKRRRARRRRGPKNRSVGRSRLRPRAIRGLLARAEVERSTTF